MSQNRNTEILELSYNKSIKAIVTVTEIENETQKGNVYVASSLGVIANGGADIVLGLTTPSDKDIRWKVPRLKSNVDYVKGVIYENISFTGDTQGTPYNTNRQSSNTSGVKLYTTFTVAPNLAGETPFETLATLGGGVGASGQGGDDEGEYWIFDRDTNYVLVLSNEDGADATYLLKNRWIETDLTD